MNATREAVTAPSTVSEFSKQQQEILDWLTSALEEFDIKDVEKGDYSGKGITIKWFSRSLYITPSLEGCSFPYNAWIEDENDWWGAFSDELDSIERLKELLTIIRDRGQEEGEAYA